MIFDKTLAHLSPVQQRLADAAAISDALALSAREGANSAASLADAIWRGRDVMNHCSLVLGAIGYTLEFPMQFYPRRYKALDSFVDDLVAWEGLAA